MTKKNLERRNKYLLLQLKMIHDLVIQDTSILREKMFENIGHIQYLSSTENIKENLRFIERYDKQFDFFNKEEDINDYE